MATSFFLEENKRKEGKKGEREKERAEVKGGGREERADSDLVFEFYVF